MSTVHQTLALEAYPERAQAEQAYQTLLQAGFQEHQIAVDSREKGSTSIQAALGSLGIPDQEALRYEQALQADQTIVLVRTNDRQQEAQQILDGAHTASETPTSGTNQAGRRIQLLAEELHAEKQRVVTGEYRIRKRVVTEEKTITVQVAHEVVEIEQINYTNDEQMAASAGPEERIVTLSPGDVIRIPVREEQVFVEKRPILVEEIIVGKQARQETRHITDTIRKEVPRIEREGDVEVQGADEMR